MKCRGVLLCVLVASLQLSVACQEVRSSTSVHNGLREHLWLHDVGAPVRSAAVVIGDSVFVGSINGRLIALDLAKGVERWSVETGGAIRSDLVEANGHIVLLNEAGRVLSVRAEDGSEVWSLETGGESAQDEWDYHLGSAAISDGMAYIGSTDGTFYALNTATGGEVWRRVLEGAIHTRPAVDDDRIYVATTSAIYGLRRGDGGQLWERPIEMPGSPAAASNTVVVGSREGYVYAFDGRTGDVRWSISHGTSWVTGDAVARDGVAYIGSSDGAQLQAIDIAEGTVRWNVSTGGNVFTRPAFVGETTVVVSGNAYSTPGTGYITATSPAGRVLWRLRGRNFFASPVVHGNVLYVGSDDGFFYAVSTRAGQQSLATSQASGR